MTSVANPLTVAGLVELIGPAEFATALGASREHVANMKRDNRIPAKKYRLTQRAAAKAGLGSVPDHLFTFDLQSPSSVETVEPAGESAAVARQA